MGTSRPIRRGEWLTDIRTGSPFIGSNVLATIHEMQQPQGYILQSDFGLDGRGGDAYWQLMRERVFGMTGDGDIHAAITNGTAPGLYVREGDDTSDWETYRQVLARRVEEAMAARRGGESWVGVGGTTAASPLTRECHWCYNSRRITHSQDDEGRVCSYCFDWPEVAQAREDAAALAAARAMPTATTRQDGEIRVGDVVEVVSSIGIDTTGMDIGRGGRVRLIDRNTHGERRVHLSAEGDRHVPIEGMASLIDVRKVTSPSPQTVAAVASPMPEGEASRIEAAVSDEVRRRISSPLASGGETTIRRVVNPVPPAVSVSLRPRDFTAAAITDYLQSLGATQVYVRQAPGNPPVVEVAGLSRQAFDTACQNLPVGIQLRVVGSFLGERDSGETTEARIIRSAQSEPPTPPPPPPSRFSLLEIDADVKDTAPLSPLQALKAAVDLAALQAELRAEREAKRALTAAQTPPGRFDLLECDLPAVPAAAAVKPAKAPPQRPGVSSPPPKPRPKTHNPVETITDLTTARSPLELARMLEGLNDELSTMMRQREAN